MTVLGLDPGSSSSAYVLWDGIAVCAHGKLPNEELLLMLRHAHQWPDAILVIERVASYGMPVGAEVFDTVDWSGRFREAWESRGMAVDRLFRREVKLHLCESPRANDATIRQALIDRFGGKATAIGLKATPGPLYGLKADTWQALALAVTYVDQQEQKARSEDR